MNKKVLYVTSEGCQYNNLEEAQTRELADILSKNMPDYGYEHCRKFAEELVLNKKIYLETLSFEYVKINDTQREQLLSLEAQILGLKLQLCYDDAVNGETNNGKYMYELVEKMVKGYFALL